MGNVKIGNIELPETIELEYEENGVKMPVEARLTFYPKNGSWNGLYIYQHPNTSIFQCFSCDEIFIYETIKSCASALRNALISKEFIKP